MPSGQIKTPSNFKVLTNVAVVRTKKAGKRFEIACYKNKVLAWRNKTEKDIDEVLQTRTVFTNVSKGQLAKTEELVAAFGSEDQLEICKQILEKGELQVSDKERAAANENNFKELANLIADMCVNPDTKRPIAVTVIEQALHDTHFAPKPNRSVKQQALEAIPKLRETMPIERAKMRLRVALPAKVAKQLAERAKALFATVEEEDWSGGDLELIGLIEPGQYRLVDELLRKEGRGHAQLELLSLKELQQGELEVS